MNTEKLRRSLANKKIRRVLRFRVLGGTLLSMACLPALAQSAGDSAVDLQNKIRLQQQIERELEENQRRAESSSEPSDAVTTPGALLEGAAYPVHDIRIDTGVFDVQVDLSDILAAYQGRMLDQQGLFALVRDVTNRYAREGFSTTTIGLLPSDLDTGVVQLRVHWGLVEGWLIDGNAPATLSEKAMVAQAMPGAIGKPLNVHDIDQAIENLNNANKAARIDVEPAERNGYSLLHVRTSDSQQPMLSLSVDNSGVRPPGNGRYRYGATANLGDVLLGNDSLTLNGSSRHYLDGADDYEYSAGVSYSVPFGRGQTDLRINETRYKSLLQGYFGDYSSSGDSRSFGLKHGLVLARDKTRKLTAFAEVEHRRSANYIEDSFLEVNSKPFTTFGYGLQYVTQWFGGSLYSDMAMVAGKSWWGGESAAFGANGEPRHFRKVGFNSAWNRGFAIGERRFDYSLRVGGQYSNDAMLSAYKQSLGDEYTVRGFKGGVLWGDRGAFVANTLTMPLKVGSLNVSPYLGLDAGYAEDRFALKSQDRTLAGAAIGVRATHRLGSVAFGWAPPLHVPDNAQDAGPVVYLSISSSM